jgi:putative nucleotidyltransferase with HDIG domain
MKIKIAHLKSGMILGENIYREALLVLSEGTLINQRHIEMLKTMAIDAVTITFKRKNIVTSDELKSKYKGSLQRFKEICYKVSLGKHLIYSDVKECLETIMSNLESNPEMAMKLWQIEAADAYTYEHSVKVCMLSVLLAKWMNYSEDALKAIATAALLHDIGKCNIPNEILNKPDTLTQEEFLVMKTHATLGFVLLSTTKALEQATLKGILHHHERYDGKGYPSKLKGKLIPEFARIIAVVDIFDAMTSTRVYREKINPFHVIEIMFGGGGGSLDPEITEIFLSKSIEFFIDTQVELSTGEPGIIKGVNPKAPHRPIVLVNQESRDLSKLLDLEIKSVIIV